MIDEEKYQKLKDYALKLLSFRPRASREIKGKLMQYSIKRGIPEKFAQKIITDLTSQNFINDEQFVKWWIEQRQTFKPKGERAIRMELRQKGIDKEVIEEVLANAKEITSEFDLGLKVVNKKISTWRHLSSEELKIKISGLLARRGFSWETIHKVIDSLSQKA